MALTGHLSDLSLSELIEFFCNQRKTGQLKVLYPQGHGYFYLQTGSVVDARIGVLRGIDAVYYALTLPNARFEFSATTEPIERTINQPWTQVVLEGLRRLDEGVIPPPAFPADYEDSEESDRVASMDLSLGEFQSARAPSFFSFMSRESMSRRRYFIAVAVTVVVLMSVAAIGVPAGWYGRASAPASTAPATTAAMTTEAPAPVVPTTQQESTPAVDTNDAATALHRQRERERIKREEVRQDKPVQNTPAPTTVVPTAPAETAKVGPKKITVTVTYDESGRVTQASGGDAGAVRIARQKRFPAGKAGSATITIPVN